MTTDVPAADNRPPAIFLMGPTASGKTDLAVALTEHLPCDLISVDSALIYRDMDIGTAKPEPELLARAPHRLIDLLDPAQSYSAADFRRDALAAMAEITAAGRIPLLVGGTMLYYKALLEGLSELPPADPGVRRGIESEAAALGWAALHEELQRVDPASAKRIHPNDPQRLSRALEIYRISGQTMTELLGRQRQVQLPYRTLQFAIAPKEREVLRQRIRLRFELMLEAGFEAEVRRLYQRGDLHLDMPSIRCVGYRQMWQYLAGELSHDEMVYRGVVATCQLAKRQMTWLRGWPGDLTWLQTGDPDNLTLVLASLQAAGIVEA